jgi:sugar lactone lactonase YvrE
VLNDESEAADRRLHIRRRAEVVRRRALVLGHAGRGDTHRRFGRCGHHDSLAPSGLGFRPDGSLLIASTRRREILDYDDGAVTVVADLFNIAPADLGDMVVDDSGCAYVGSQAAERGLIVPVDPSGGVTVVADGLDFPNGMVITQDRSTLIVAESLGRRLTAYATAGDSSLHSRRVFADALDRFPDGITLDADGGVWVSMTLAHQFERIVEGGGVTDRIHMGGRAAIACTLGGPEGRTLFLLSSTGANPTLPDSLEAALSPRCSPPHWSLAPAGRRRPPIITR